ncbi:MAG: SUMF1/EgtB/PvdO family nonheme iron enzyme, partial [Bacteroidota bacterium]
SLLPDKDGCDKLTGSFCRYYGAAVRHAPNYTLKDVLGIAWWSKKWKQKHYQNVLGNVASLNQSVGFGSAFTSSLTKSESERLMSDHPGTVEDGMQALWSALNDKKKRSDAVALAKLIAWHSGSQTLWQSAESLERSASQRAILSVKGKELEEEHVSEILGNLIPVEAGEAIVGSDPKNDAEALPEEIPQHTIRLPEFSLSKYSVTRGDWQRFQEAIGIMDLPRLKKSELLLPVTYISFYEALDYIAWVEHAARKYKLLEPDASLTLPSEMEWEVAARGRHGQLYPWGNEFEPVCNFKKNSQDKIKPVGSFSPEGDSPFGLSDMAGNSWDWTRSLWGKGGRKPEFGYPYNAEDGRERIDAPEDVRRVVRGGAYYYADAWCLRCATRNIMFPSTRHSGGGFRIAKVPATSV